MKKILLLTIYLMLNSQLFSQVEPQIKQPRTCFTIGFLQGGGSWVGFDFEYMLSKRVALQAGAGVFGYGGGLNIHFKPTNRSSFVSFQYWHQGFDELFVQSVAGPNFVFRGKKWFTFQAGVGATLEQGVNYPVGRDFPPVILMYSIGVYII